MNAPAVASNSALLERVVIEGDLGRLSEKDRVAYYAAVCSSVGLNPLTQPFAYIRLNGKVVLYATKACTEQLRTINGVSLTITSRDLIDGVYVVTARAKDAKGREDEATGAVAIDNLKVENKANAMMKAETKAKRRVTLSICGLGLLDESETDSIRGAEIVPVPELAKEDPEAGLRADLRREISAAAQAVAGTNDLEKVAEVIMDAKQAADLDMVVNDMDAVQLTTLLDMIHERGEVAA